MMLCYTRLLVVAPVVLGALGTMMLIGY